MSQSTPASHVDGASRNKRGSREEDAASSATPGFFARLFSSAKRPRTADISTDSTTMDLIFHGESPTTKVVPPMGKQSPDDTALQTFDIEALPSTVNGTGMSGLIGERNVNGAVLGWKPPGPPTFKMGTASKSKVSLQPYRRRYVPTRPESYTLVARSRNKPPPKEWDPVDFQTILQSNRTLFVRSNEDDVSDVAILTTKRVLGLNQRGSRHIPFDKGAIVSVSCDQPKKEVSFAPLDARTPQPTHFEPKPRLKRQQTPGVQQTPQSANLLNVTSPPHQLTSTPSTTSVVTVTYPSGAPGIMQRVQRFPRTNFDLNNPYIFDAELFPSGRIHGKAKFFPMPMPTKLIDFNHSPSQCTRQFFIRPEQEVEERQAQTTYTVDDDDDDGDDNKQELSETAEAEVPAQKKVRSEGWGANMFADKNKWKCEICLVRNEMTASKCVSCETIRPGHEAPQARTVPPASGGSSSALPFTFGVKSTTPAQTSSHEVKPFSFSLDTSKPPNDALTKGSSVGFSFGVTESSKTGRFTINGTADNPQPSVTTTDHATDSLSTADSVPAPSISTSKPNLGAGAFAFSSGASSAPGKAVSSNDLKPFVFQTNDNMKDQSSFKISSSAPSEDSNSTRRKRQASGVEHESSSSTPGRFSSEDKVLPTPAAPSATFSFGAPVVPAVLQPPASSAPIPSFTFRSSVPLPTSGDSNPFSTLDQAPKSSDATSPAPLSAPTVTFGSTVPSSANASEIMQSVSLDATSKTSEAETPAPAKPAFTFGSSNPVASKGVDTKPSVSFAVTPKTSESAAPFSFGTGLQTPASSGINTTFAGHTPGFSTDTLVGSSTPAPTFSFGASSAATPSNNIFQAGSTPGPSSFGNSSVTPAVTNPFASASTTTPSLGNSFNAGGTSAQASFGSQAAPSFSLTPAPPVLFSAVTPSAGISFGGASSGGVPAAPAVSFGTTPSFGGVQSGPTHNAFGGAGSFGQTPTQPTNNAFGGNSAPMNSFNSGPITNGFGGVSSMTTPMAGGFNMGSTAKTTGRRIVRAKRK